MILFIKKYFFFVIATIINMNDISKCEIFIVSIFHVFYYSMSKGIFDMGVVDKDFSATIKNKVRDAHINNVEIIFGDIEKKGGTSLRDGIVDAVIVSNVLSQVGDKEQLILEIQRISKQKGRVLLIDWSQLSIMGAKNIIQKDKAREMFEKKGFVWQRDINAG